ncbi:MAG: PD40 domain-containing protein [Chloroflexi bacterium]|nr:PD40 domain-containing protein [Chloroflexota bacterium]
MATIIDNRVFRTVLTSLLLASMLTISAPLKMVAGANGVTVSVNAPDYVTPDTTFTATINITEVINFDSASYDVSFNPSIVEVTGVNGGKIGTTDIPVNLWNETEPGRISIAQNVPNFYGVNGTGHLAAIRFHVLGSPGQSSNITLANGILGNNTGQAIPATWAGDLVRITAHQTATVSINAPEVVYKDSNFSTTIDISQVTNFDAANYAVLFDPAVLQITGVTGGKIGTTDIPVLWNQTEPGRIAVVQNIPGTQGASGAGSLATLGFRVLGLEGQSSNITLANVILSDGTAQVIPAVWIGDSIRITLPVQPVLSTVPYPPSRDFGTVPEGDTRQWSFAITNSGTGTLEWTVTDDQPWITLSPTNGTTTNETDNVTVTVNTSGLASNVTNSGSVTVTSNGGNVTGTMTVSVLALPVDLTVSSLTHTPVEMADGDTVSFTATVSNAGTGRTLSDFYVRFDIDGIAVGHRRVVGGLGVGQSLELTQVWQASSGNHTATATVDEYNDIVESNETNNALSQTLPYIPFPDLVTSNITYSPLGNINQGDEITFTATVKNSGAGGTSREFHILFEIDGAYIGQQKLSGLVAGASVNVSQVWTAEMGTHTVTAIADRFNTVAESNENNNRLSLALSGASAPDLIVERINWLPSGNISEGASVTVNATITNIGTGALAGSFFVRFEVDGTILGRQQVTGGLAPGQSVSVTNAWLAKVGIHTVKVIADEFNTVIELNEANNELSQVLPAVVATDLVVTTITWLPATNIYDGQEVTVTATVNNTGAGATSKSFSVRFEIDGNYIGRQTVSGGLGIGESKNVSQTWTAQVGLHAVKAIVDEYNDITESNETNNQLSQALPAVLAPDLTVIAITWLPSENISDGQPVTLTATLENIGTGNTSRDFYVRFEIDNTYIGHQLVSGGLAVGQAKQVSQVWTARTGIHTAKAIADENNTVTESNETNNEWSQVLPQVPASDLVVTAVTWLPSENISDGQPVTLKATVKNIGTGNTTRDFYVRFEVDDKDAGQQSITGGLAVGETKEVSQTWAAQVGTHTVKATADGNNTVAESNETNNSLSQTLPEVVASDLVITAVTWLPSENIPDGQPVTLTAVVKNIGTGNTARDFYVRFEIDNTYIGHQLVSGGLAIGQSKQVSQVWTAAPGSHTAKAIADEGNAVAESNETNNSLSQTLPQITASDLVVAAIAWSPQTGIGDGNSVTLTATVKNIGGGDTARDFYVSFKVDGSAIGQQLISGGLAAGEIKAVSQVWTAIPGSHTATAIADEGNAITESNETNNSLSQALPQITASDLTITAITWSPQAGINDGNSVTLTATVQNSGTGNTTRNFYVRFEVDNTYIGHQLVGGGLAVGQAKQVDQVWTAAPGSHTAKATADEGNAIAESDETNNGLYQALPQVVASDLTITGISWQPADLLHGGIVTFAATVENSGAGGTSREFDVRFEVDGNLIGRQKVSGLGSNIQVYQKWVGSSGAQKVTAIADEHNVVAESNENNNSASQTLPRIPSPPQVTLTTPNGGQTWYGVQDIFWQAASPEGFPLIITLELYNGSIYRPIAEYLPNTGSFQWDTRRLADGSRVNDSTGYQVRVTATDSLGVSSSDSSDTWFTIFNVPEVRISAAPGFQKTTEQVVTTYVLTIYNKQPYPDAFNLPLANTNSAAVAKLSQDTLNLDAWATATVSLDVTDETPGSFPVSVSAISQTNPAVANTVTVLTEVIPSFTIDVQASPTVTSIEGSLEYKVVLHNQQKVNDTFNINVSGIAPGWFVIGNAHLLSPGETKIIPLLISVPDTASSGNFTVTVQAISANWNSARQGSAPLTVIAEPIISGLSPQNGTRTGSTDVTFIWKTSVASDSQVFFRVEGTTSYNSTAGASGREHAVLVQGLTRNTWYEFYVRSATVHGVAQSEVRRLFIDNGITFTQRQYNFTVEMDYNQQVTLQVRNTDDESHQLLVTIASPPPDIAVGFIREGSRDQAITLQPGEAKNVVLAIHTQDARTEDYSFRIELTTGGANPIYDYANVNVHIRIPNINFTLEEIGSSPINLTKTLKLTNNGDPITNFVVTGDENLSGLIYFSPVIEHVRLNTAESVEFKVVPILSENFSSLNGNIVALGAGTTVTLPLSFSLPAGKRVYVGSAAAALKARTDNWTYPEAEVKVMEFTENKVHLSSYFPSINGTVELSFETVRNVPYQPTQEELNLGIGVYNPHFQLVETEDRYLITFDAIVSGGSFEQIKQTYDIGKKVYGAGKEAARNPDEQARLDNEYHNGHLTQDAYEIGSVLNDAKSIYLPIGWAVDKVLPGVGKIINQYMNAGFDTALAGVHIAGRHAAELEEAYAMIDGVYSSKGWYCSNGAKVEPTFDIPDSVQPGNLPPTLYAGVNLYPDPRFNEVVKPHYSEPYLNGHPLGPIPDPIPNGTYLMPFSPSFLNYARNGTARNVIKLVTGNFNPGHYVVATDFTIYIPLKDVQIAVIAGNQAEANQMVATESGSMVIKPDFAIYPSDIKQGSLLVRIHNTGSLGGATPYQVFDGNTLIYSNLVIIPSFSSTTLTIPWNGTPGQHDITVRLNPNRTVPERNYSNNNAINAVYVAPSTTDQTPPTIGNLQPPANSTTRYSRPPIRADLSDAGSGVNTASVTISVDGNNVTANATVTGSQVSYMPPAALANGQHNVAVYAADNLGNSASANWSFTVNSAPEITNLQPPPGAIISDTTPLISADLSDVDWGIDTNSVTIALDGIGVTGNASVSSSRVWYLPATPLALGGHSVTVYTRDNAGNSASANWSFTIAIPPLLSNLQATGISATTATISWDTDKASDSLVMFGTTSGNYTYQKSDDQMLLSHTIRLAGLTPQTTYRYIVRSTDPIGAFSESQEQSFVTTEVELVKISPDNNPLPAFRWSAAANAISYEVRIDSGNWTNVGARLTYVQPSILSRGIYTLGVRAKDGLGNVTTESAITFNVSVVADLANTKIAFDSNRTGDYELFTMSANGSALIRLTNNTADDTHPAWSPDGSRIAFSSNRDGNDEIYVMNLNGSNLMRLTDNPTYDGYPEWSPDGQQIAFMRTVNSITEIFVMSQNGTDVRRLTTSGFSEGNWHPSWSPDGSQIVYVSRATGNWEVWLMNVDGSGKIQLTTDGAGSKHLPRFLPDGSKILFAWAPAGTWNIYQMNPDGSSILNLTNSSAQEGDPYPSPDGQRIAFQRSYDVYVMNRDGSAQTNLTNNTALDFNPAWSPFLLPPGDANGDGAINVLDLTKVARIILLQDAETPGADVNLDGVVNVLDMSKLVRLILKLD